MVKAFKFFKRLNCMSSCCTCCCNYDTLRDDFSQIVKLPNGESVVVHGYEKSCAKCFLFVVVNIFTCFLWFVVTKTCSSASVPWFYRRSTLSKATKVLLPPQSLVDIQQDVDGRRWFVWRHHRFSWCVQSGKFKRVRYVDEIGLRFTDIHGLGNGLDSSNHQLRKNNFGKNTTEIEFPSFIKLFFSAMVKPFRIFHCAALSIWITQKYYVYAGLIGLAAIAEIGITVFLKYQHHRRLHRISVCRSQVTVLSPGHEKRKVISDDLVPGSVIELYRQDNIIIPCDAVILSGSCFARESADGKLNHKCQLPKSRTEVYYSHKHRHHTLFRGSSIVMLTDKVVALVIRTGWSTENGSILAAKMDSLVQKSHFDRYCDRLFVCLAFAGLCATAYGIYDRQTHIVMEILNLLPQGLNLFLICLPPLFQPALFFTSSYALIRLHKSGFHLNSYKESHSILNNAGATDTVCLLEYAVKQNAESNLSKISSTRYDEWSRDPQLTLCMASCINQHDLSDVEMSKNSAWRNLIHDGKHTVQSVANDHEIYRITKIYVNESHSSLPLTLVRADPIESINAASWYFLRGAYTSVLEFSEEFSFENKDNELEYVAFAGRPLTEQEKSSPLDPDLNLLSRKFQLLGVATLEFKVAKDTFATISELRSAGLRTLLISRRGAEEAVQLARSAGLIYAKEPVGRIEVPSIEAMHPPSLSVVDLPETGLGADLRESGIEPHAHVVLTGDTLDALLQSFPEMVNQIIERVTVFAAATALQTNRFLEKLHELDHTILVGKDNEDYCPSLPVTCLTLTRRDEREVLHRDFCTNRSISSIREFLAQSRASLAKCLGICKLMVCYAAARLTSTLLLYHYPSSAIQTLFVDLALVMAPSFLFGLTKMSTQPLSKKMPARSVAHPKETLSVIVQLLLIVSSQCFALVMAQHQPWFERTSLRMNWTESPISSDENYAVYSLSLFQYLNLFVVFFAGPPHLQRIWTNIASTLYLIMMMVFCSVIVLEPPEELKYFMGLKIPPVFDFRLALLSLAFIYIFTSLGVQCLIDYCSLPSCSCRNSNRSLDEGTLSLHSVNINVLYRPYTLTTQTQLSNDLPHPTSVNLPIF